MRQDYIPERALLIFAHPDDIEFAVAGTAAKWAQGGGDVTYVVITDGNVGTHDRSLSKEALAAVRRQEQSAAAETAGASRCLFLGYDDGVLAPTLSLRKQLVRLIRQYQPNVVVCGDPTAVVSDTRINHPDHRAAATAAIDAVFPACEMHLLYTEFEEEGIMPHQVNYVLMSTWQEPNYFVDISSSFDLKLDALRQHKSQLGDWDPEERMRKRAQAVGAQAGLAAAEGYKLITIKEQ